MQLTSPVYWSKLTEDNIMLQKIGSYDAKSKLPEILRRVEKGEAFTITNRGKPVADLIPSRTNDALKTKDAINNILKAKKHHISDEILNELKDSGRK
jgi:prevent-host-death family protein